MNATSRPWAPWYAIPADDKPFMRMCVAEIISKNLEHLGLHYPSVTKATRQSFAKLRKQLQK